MFSERNTIFEEQKINLGNKMYIIYYILIFLKETNNFESAKLKRKLIYF